MSRERLELESPNVMLMKVVKKKKKGTSRPIAESPTPDPIRRGELQQAKGNIMTVPMKQLCSFSCKVITRISLGYLIKNSHLTGLLSWKLKGNFVQYLYWDLHIFTLRPGLDFSTYKTSAETWRRKLSYSSSKAWFAREKVQIEFSPLVWFLPSLF